MSQICGWTVWTCGAFLKQSHGNCPNFLGGLHLCKLMPPINSGKSDSPLLPTAGYQEFACRWGMACLQGWFILSFWIKSTAISVVGWKCTACLLSGSWLLPFSPECIVAGGSPMASSYKCPIAMFSALKERITRNKGKNKHCPSPLVICILPSPSVFYIFVDPCMKLSCTFLPFAKLWLKWRRFIPELGGILKFTFEMFPGSTEKMISHNHCVLL